MKINNYFGDTEPVCWLPLLVETWCQDANEPKKRMPGEGSALGGQLSDSTTPEDRMTQLKPPVPLGFEAKFG